MVVAETVQSNEAEQGYEDYQSGCDDVANDDNADVSKSLTATTESPSNQSSRLICGWKPTASSSKRVVAESNHDIKSSRIVAFALAKVENNIFTFSKKKRSISGHITNLVVLNPFRRHGIAKKLMLHVQERLTTQNKIQFISLHVREHNTSAIQLYESLGYRMVSTLPRYYQNGDNAARMELQFGNNDS